MLHLLVVSSLFMLALSAPLPSQLVEVPQLICSRNIETIKDLLVFYGTSYVAHAISVPSGEVGRYTKRAAIRFSFPYTSIISFFLPFGGLARSILLINQQLKWRKKHLHAALVHGTLLLLARTEGWAPSETEDEFVYVKIPPAYYGCEKYMDGEIPRWHAAFHIDNDHEEDSHWEVDQNDYLLHGEQRLPEGYTLAVPSDKTTTEHILDQTIQEPHKIQIHRSTNTLKIFSAIIQIGAAIFTLSLPEPDQFSRWGYAAYALSVIPYALMSAVNMACTAIVGDQSSGHILRTHILEEAERRPGGLFDGTVGRLREASKLCGTQAASGYTAVKLRLETMHSNGEVVRVVSVNDGKSIKKFIHSPGSTPRRDQLIIFKISAISHDGPLSEEQQDPAPDGDLGIHSHSSAVLEDSQVKSLAHSASGKTYFRRGETEHASREEIVAISSALFIVTCIPYALLYVITRFRAGSSTVVQRAAMMAWLAADQLAAFTTLLVWVIRAKWGRVVPSWVHYLFVVIFMIPAGFGLVMVVQMYLEEKNFGPSSCTNSTAS
ncbi:uncharacterized protein FIBRA_08246 [Fibroporia radiculosa]|uniref:DUF805 domain-containing protein n=1 Tax=Fibroporia radiculosa TaxID=599839 RepID=J4GGX1_9APHY|nr:uncharacterized protein FIBRA_08246 [Fibroporia radiculosa]CCM06003.1 predicted protein [Fibroporia radiculosa]